MNSKFITRPVFLLLAGWLCSAPLKAQDNLDIILGPWMDYAPILNTQRIVSHETRNEREIEFYDTKLKESCKVLIWHRQEFKPIADALNDYRMITFERIRKRLAPQAMDLTPMQSRNREIHMEFRLVHHDETTLVIVAHMHVYGGGASTSISHKAFNFRKVPESDDWTYYDPLQTTADANEIIEQAKVKLREMNYSDHIEPPFHVFDLPQKYVFLFAPHVVTVGAFGSISLHLDKN